MIWGKTIMREMNSGGYDYEEKNNGFAYGRCSCFINTINRMWKKR